MKYLSILIRHKWFVLVAGLRLGGIPLWRLMIHDYSKFSLLEFSQYNNKFVRKKYKEEKWKKAWQHHIRLNPHHWQHWVSEGTAKPIPEVFVREMVADWLAAGRAYKGSWDIQEWIDRNYPKINLHIESKQTLRKVLAEIDLSLPRVYGI